MPYSVIRPLGVKWCCNETFVKSVVAKNVGHVGHCRRQDPNVRWVLCKHQTICPTAQTKTWLSKCLQSRKNCQCTSSLLLNEVCYFPLWVTGVLYEKNDPNHVLIDGRKWGLLAVMVTNATLALFESVPTRATICHSCQWNSYLKLVDKMWE